MYEFSFRRSLVAIFKSPDPQVKLNVSHQIWRKLLPEISCSQTWDWCEEPKQNQLLHEWNFQGICEMFTRTRQTVLWGSRSRQRHRTSLQNLSTSWRNRIKWTSREKKEAVVFISTKENLIMTLNEIKIYLTAIRSAAPPIVLMQEDFSPYLQQDTKKRRCRAIVLRLSDITAENISRDRLTMDETKDRKGSRREKVIHFNGRWRASLRGLIRHKFTQM